MKDLQEATTDQLESKKTAEKSARHEYLIVADYGAQANSHKYSASSPEQAMGMLIVKLAYRVLRNKSHTKNRESVNISMSRLKKARDIKNVWVGCLRIDRDEVHFNINCISMNSE